jgi:Domain of unknown function (DUF4249)
MVNVKKISRIILLAVLLPGCLDPYQPPTSDANTDLLVINGHINSTDNVAYVRITRALPLTGTEAYPPETNADVAIEDEEGNSLKLPEVASDTYSLSHLFNLDVRHRLGVLTKGKEYVSEFIALVKNSEIDSLTWKADQDKLEVSVHTHDNTEGTKYYRYMYDETYEYTARMMSYYKIENGFAIERTGGEYTFRCWKAEPSTPILVASTQNLRENLIAGYPVINIARGDRRLWLQYSALVRQYAIDKEA